MKARNLETGVISKVGDKFLVQQAKPFIAASGKIYKDGVWVAYNEKPMSAEAAKVIEKAKAPAGAKVEESAEAKDLVADAALKAPDAEVKAPEAEVKAPEVKAPEAEAKVAETKAPEPPKAPDAKKQA